MPSVACLRRQADVCLKLSLLTSDLEIAGRLVVMAEEYTAKANSASALDDVRDAREGGNSVRRDSSP